MMGRRAAVTLAVLGVALLVAMGAALALNATRTTSDAASDASNGSASTADHSNQAGAAVDLTAAPDPVRLSPQGDHAQFIVKCEWSHNATDDPIVHPGSPGLSHLHEFFGSSVTNALTTVDDLLGSDTTCENRDDTAAYWVPALYEGAVRVPPQALTAYYRTGVDVDAAEVEPWPLGLKMLAGDPGAEGFQPVGYAAWTCGASDHLTPEPRDCTPRAPLTMRLTFPDCWDGTRLDSTDHRSHVAYSRGGECPVDNPVPIVQLILSIRYGFHTDPSALRLASGATTTVHGDVLNGWSHEELTHLTDLCLRRDAICGIASNRTDIRTELFESGVFGEQAAG
jgi:hypothetical protein